MDGGGCFEWPERDKENEDARNPSLCAFRFSRHIYRQQSGKFTKDYYRIRIICERF